MHRVFLHHFVRTAASTVAVMLVPYAVRVVVTAAQRQLEKRRGRIETET
jgi:hypothetical protein